MNKLKEISVLAIFVIAVLFFSGIVKNNSANKQKFDITLPDSTVSYSRIESSFILKRIVFNELFVIKDKRLFEKLKLISENQEESDLNLDELNVDFFSPIEIIECNYKGETLQFLRLNSVSKDESISKKPILNFQVNEQTYFLLSDKKINAIELKKWLQQHSKLHYSPSIHKEIHLASFENCKEIEQSDVSILKNRIKMVVRHQKSELKNNRILKANGFHISFDLTQGIPLDSTLTQIPLIPKINFPFKNIRQVSMNYYGFKFPTDDTIIGVPKIDLLLTFQNPTKIDSLIIDLKRQLKFDYPIAENEIRYGKERLYFQQISTKTIYLSSLNPKTQLSTTSHPFYIKGDLNLLTKMENAGWKGMFIEVLPMFKSTKKLLQKTNSIQYFQTASNEHTIVIPMKKNQDVYHELILYILSTQVD